MSCVFFLCSHYIDIYGTVLPGVDMTILVSMGILVWSLGVLRHYSPFSSPALKMVTFKYFIQSLIMLCISSGKGIQFGMNALFVL